MLAFTASEYFIQGASSSTMWNMTSRSSFSMQCQNVDSWFLKWQAKSPIHAILSASCSRRDVSADSAIAAWMAAASSRFRFDSGLSLLVLSFEKYDGQSGNFEGTAPGRMRGLGKGAVTVRPVRSSTYEVSHIMSSGWKCSSQTYKKKSYFNFNLILSTRCIDV